MLYDSIYTKCPERANLEGQKKAQWLSRAGGNGETEGGWLKCTEFFCEGLMTNF